MQFERDGVVNTEPLPAHRPADLENLPYVDPIHVDYKYWRSFAEGSYCNSLKYLALRIVAHCSLLKLVQFVQQSVRAGLSLKRAAMTSVDEMTETLIATEFEYFPSRPAWGLAGLRWVSRTEKSHFKR